MSVACPTSHLAPRVVQAWSTPVAGLLDIGRYPSGIDQVCEEVAADFRLLLGRMRGIPTPANELMQRLAREIAVTHGAPGAVPAATILQRLERSGSRFQTPGRWRPG